MKNLETKRYLLRKPKMEDAEEIYEKWGKDKENVGEYKEHYVHKNIIETKALLKAAIKEAEFGTPTWFIEEKETKVIIGYMKVPTFSEKDKICEITFYFLPKWRKDFSPEEVIGEVIKYLFTEQPFEVVVTKFYDRLKEDTECLSSILERIGMKKEGILRNRMINSKGQKIDRHVYSILKEEWENY